MKAKVERCQLSKDFSISKVLTGLWQIADMERDSSPLDLEATAAAMSPYVNAGFTTFDMADHYGSAEEIAGIFQKQHGPGVQLLTKWVPKPGQITRNDVRTNLHRALDRMQVPSVDLLQFHAWDYTDPNWLDSLFWLQELKEEGLIHHLGLTNFDTTHLRIIVNSGIEVVSNQVCFSLLDQRAKNGMTDFCLQRDIKLLVFGTVAGGFLTEQWLNKSEPQLNKLKTWSQMKYLRFIYTAGGWILFQELLHTLNNIAKRLGVSISNIACRYILEEPSVGGIIIGARLGKSEHIKDNLRLFQFTLDQDSRKEIGEALTRLKPIPGDCGDEYRRPPFLTASGDLSHHMESLPLPYQVHIDKEGKSRILNDDPGGDKNGSSLAIRYGDRIAVSKTNAGYGDRVIGGQDPAAQLNFILDKIEGLIKSLGGGLEDIISTSVYFSNILDLDVLTKVYKARFSEIMPASKFAPATMAHDQYLVEMEAEAEVSKLKH
jgi:aryl-alcohol dehydrogenase-like predicted oxidoreductase/enamine deaminase RidA (YjgF/YER057c/UK114 family)